MIKSSAPTKILVLALAAGFFAAGVACAAFQLPLRPNMDRWPPGMVVAYIASINGKRIAVWRNKEVAVWSHAKEQETLELADDVVFCKLDRDGITSIRMPDAQYLKRMVGRRAPATFEVVEKHKIKMIKVVWDGLPPKGTPYEETEDYPKQLAPRSGLEYSYPKKCN
jgi:hypothetical protein